MPVPPLGVVLSVLMAPFVQTDWLGVGLINEGWATTVIVCDSALPEPQVLLPITLIVIVPVPLP